LIAVAPLFAVEATETAPTIRKQVPVQKPAPKLAKDKLMAHSTNFWDFEFVRLEVKGVVINRAKKLSYDVDVKVGEIVKFTVQYKVKTPPIKDIYEADASVWGSGKISYTNILSIEHGQRIQNYCYRKIETCQNLRGKTYNSEKKFHWDVLSYMG